MIARRPNVALAVFPGLERVIVPTPLIDRLAATANLVSDMAIDLTVNDLRQREIEVLLGGWGCPPLDYAILARMPNLRLIAYAAGNVEGTVTDAVWARGITVSTGETAAARPIAEFCFAAIIMTAKDVLRRRDELRLNRGGNALTLGHSGPVGNRGRTIGIVGLTPASRLLCGRLQSIDAHVLVCDRHVRDDEAALLGAHKVDLDQLLRRCDVVTLHASVQPGRAADIGAAELGLLRDDAWIINVGRGSLIDTHALTAVAESGRINAWLDTTEPDPLPSESRLFDLPNVVLTPRLAGPLGNEVYRMGELAVAEIERYVRGEPLLHEVARADLVSTR